MRDGKYWHFKTYQGIRQAKGYVFHVCVRTQFLDRTSTDECGNEDRLPERKEKNALDAEELRYRSGIKNVSDRINQRQR